MTEPVRAPLAPPTTATKPRRGTLAAVIGSIVAAGALFTMTSREESGRKVVATVAADGTATLRHVSGPQYLAAYRDIIDVVTICDGDTTDVKMGQVATPAECTARLERQLVAHAEGVVACVPQLFGRTHQVTAAVLLAYNIGVPRFCGSSVARRIKADDWRGAAEAFALWNRVTVPAKQVDKYRRRGESCARNSRGLWSCTVKGLTSRRARERALFVRGLA